MTTYLGTLSHGAHAIDIHRLGSRIRWTLHLPGGVGEQQDGPQAELRRRALPIRYRIDQKEPS